MANNSTLESDIIIEVPFHDVDSMQVVWHGNYCKYLEVARCKFLDEIDYNYRQMQDSGFAWPVIDMRIRYAQPLYFQQQVRVISKIVEWENRLKINYLLEDAISGRRLSKAFTVQVAVDLANAEMLFASPPVLLEKLGVS